MRIKPMESYFTSILCCCDSGRLLDMFVSFTLGGCDTELRVHAVPWLVYRMVCWRVMSGHVELSLTWPDRVFEVYLCVCWVVLLLVVCVSAGEALMTLRFLQPVELLKA